MQNPDDLTPAPGDESLQPPDPSVWFKMSPEEISASWNRVLAEIGDQSEDLRWLNAAARAMFRRLEGEERQAGCEPISSYFKR